ncbi:hypothetical protein E4U13_006399 [Claviceps humidiphila]|uniref:Uncharacterized protein n=1 Tax=Claviceps humidiphila TaxID=1294629 RepID=A0A9P7TQL7_9HYPO|nr:hypothetical protein E4U13_006399 [Claviceps humidiphila]
MSIVTYPPAFRAEPNVAFCPDVIDKSLYNAESVIGIPASESQVATLMIGGAVLAGNLKLEEQTLGKEPKAFAFTCARTPFVSPDTVLYNG